MSIVNTRRGMLLSGSAMLLLAGCSGLVGPPPASQLYALQPIKPPLAAGPKVSWSLAVQSPAAPGNLDSNRLSLVRGATMDFYANAELPERLPRLIQTGLLEAFESSGRIDQLSRSDEGLRSDYLLQTDIRNCEAQYVSADDAPKAVVRIAAKLVNTFDRRIMMNFIAAQEVQASEDSIPAVLQAMNQASGAVIAMIVNWALTASAPVNNR